MIAWGRVLRPASTAHVSTGPWLRLSHTGVELKEN